MKNLSEVKKDFIWHMEAAGAVDEVEVKSLNLKHEIREQTYSVLSEVASKKIGKPIGKYSILLVPPHEKLSPTSWEYAVSRLSRIINGFLGQLSDQNRILVVGLGNRQILADSLGVACLKHVVATGNCAQSGVPQVFTLLSGVLEQTGLESSDFVSIMAEKLKIDKIIVIDTLCANNYNRLGTSFQINNGGIVPGKGVKKGKKPISPQCYGANVLSIGVPLVIFANDLIKNAIMEAQQQSKTNAKIFNEFCDNIAKQKNIYSKNLNKLIVTPSNIDAIVSGCGKIIGYALNKSLNKLSVSSQKKWLEL